MTEPTTASAPADGKKPAPKKRGPKPAADLDAVTRVGAEFRAIWATIDDSKSGDLALQIVRCPMGVDFTRLAAACAALTAEQRSLAVAMCEALAK